MDDTLLLSKNKFIWSLLAFQGGFLNISGYITLHMFVSHITGFFAQFSLSLYNNDILMSFGFLSIPLFFLFGSFFSSFFTELRKIKNQPPVYFHIMGLLCFIFFIIFYLGEMGFFGIFGDPFHNKRDFILLSLLTFACGIQNAMFTHYAGAIIRTTHLTGVITDLGIGLSRLFVNKSEKELNINFIRLNLIHSFIIGSLLGAILIHRLEYKAFLIPFFLSLFIGFRLFFTHKSRFSS